MVFELTMYALVFILVFIFLNDYIYIYIYIYRYIMYSIDKYGNHKSILFKNGLVHSLLKAVDYGIIT